MSDIKYDDSSWHDSGLNAVYYFEMFSTATNPLDQANYLVELNNSIADLKTWLPGYNMGTGVLSDPRGE